MSWCEASERTTAGSVATPMRLVTWSRPLSMAGERASGSASRAPIADAQAGPMRISAMSRRRLLHSFSPSIASAMSGTASTARSCAQRPDRLPAHGGITVAEELDQAGDRGGVTQSAGEPAGLGAPGRGAGFQSGELAPGGGRKGEHVADPVGFGGVEPGERLEAGDELQAILGMR